MLSDASVVDAFFWNRCNSRGFCQADGYLPSKYNDSPDIQNGAAGNCRFFVSFPATHNTICYSSNPSISVFSCRMPSMPFAPRS